MSTSEAKRAIGLMSGTSMDGIDVAFVTTDGCSIIERGPAREYVYTPDQVKQLEKAVAAGAEADDPRILCAQFADLEATLTEWHADAVRRFESETGERADLIGFHGQTIAHRPEAGWTVQLGDGEGLARKLDRAVVFDLRADDMAAGGQGAPLVPIYHDGLARHLFDEAVATIAFLNIGGIANATITRPGERPVAFDCGPGNVLLDRWVQREIGVPYDAGGRIASEGRIVREWIDAELARPFFELRGPRSLDRLDFDLPEPGRFDISGGARTLARFTAEAAITAITPYEPDLTIVCGGGRLNSTLMADLTELSTCRAVTAEELGFDGGAIEAEAFAYLAVRSVNGDPLTYPETTGVGRPTTGGRLVRP